SRAQALTFERRTELEAAGQRANVDERARYGEPSSIRHRGGHDGRGRRALRAAGVRIALARLSAHRRPVAPDRRTLEERLDRLVDALIVLAVVRKGEAACASRPGRGQRASKGGGGMADHNHTPRDPTSSA